MNCTKLESKVIIGLKVRTTNENMQAIKDLGELWQKFMTFNIAEKMGNRAIDPWKIYGVYFDYEKDHTKPYSFIAGIEVDANSEVPEGLTKIEIPTADYTTFDTIPGELQDRVGEVWGRIWNSDLNRSYTYDLEVYDYSKGSTPNIEVLIS